MAQQQSVERPATAANETPANEPAPKEPAASEKVRGSSGYATLAIVGFVLVALIASLVVVGLKRYEHTRELNAAAAQLSSALSRVSVATARWAPPTSELTLPGEAQPIRGAALYGRVNGYLKGWRVDIGDRVQEGQLLAEISSPDVDDQLAQAQANLVLAKSNLLAAQANLDLAKITLKRNLEANRSSSARSRSSRSTRTMPRSRRPLRRSRRPGPAFRSMRRPSSSMRICRLSRRSSLLLPASSRRGPWTRAL